MNPPTLIPVKLAVYITAFWVFGALIVRRKPMPALGWSALGGLARFLAGGILGSGLGIALFHLRAPFAIVVLAFSLFRFVLWWGMATFLFQPARRPALIFAASMTLLNFALDAVFFGWPTARDMEAFWG